MKLVHSFVAEKNISANVVAKKNIHASVCIIMSQTLNNNVLRTNITFFYYFKDNDFNAHNTNLFPYHLRNKITFRCPKHILILIELMLRDLISSFKNNVDPDLAKKILAYRPPIISDSIKRKLLSFLLEQQKIMNRLKDGQTIIQPILI